MHKMIEAENLFNHLQPALREVCARLAAVVSQLADFAIFYVQVRREILHLGEAVAGAMLAQGLPSLRVRERDPACTTCKKTMAFKQMRPMELRTCLTGVPQTVQSPYWQCRDCHRGYRHSGRLEVCGISSKISSRVRPFVAATGRYGASHVNIFGLRSFRSHIFAMSVTA